MIGWEEAQARILAMAAPLAVETVPLAVAAGRWSATDVVALRTQPARDLSAMDGYAIRFADLPGPWRVVGEAAAGVPFAGATGAGDATRIFTGAAVPKGADTVIVQEDVARERDTLTLTGGGPPAPGSSIRQAGSDFARGSVLIPAGVPLTPVAIGLAAIGGHGSVDVHRRVRVAIISTGNELVVAGTSAGEDRLPNSNAPMLAAMLRTLPVDVVELGIVEDELNALTAAFDRARDCDVIVTSGGASVGDHDLVRPALLAAGATIDFWKVAMRPGKPLMAGRLGDAVVLGLPGNPVSAFVTATLFLRPLVAHLAGDRNARTKLIGAQLSVAMPAVGPRTDFVRARWAGPKLEPIGSHDSGALLAALAAEALIVRYAGSSAIAADAMVEAILLA